MNRLLEIELAGVRTAFLSAALGLASLCAVGADWLVDPSEYAGKVYEKDGRLVLENGLVRRELLISPDVTTWSFKCQKTDEEYVRALDAEAEFLLDGK